jgi:UDP-glucose:(heptosyl)LPS alpha-1,3-glucosyltransferase
MRITMALRHFHPKGGAEKYSLNLAAHLVKQGHRVRVIALSAQPMDGVEIVRLRKPLLVWHPMRQWVTARILGEALARDEHDVSFGEQKIWGADVVRPGGGVEVEYWRAYRLYRYHPRHVPSPIMWAEPKRWFDLLCEQRIYASPALRRVIVNSRMIRDELLRHYPALEGRIRVVHNGVAPPDNSCPSADRKHTLTGLGLDPDALTALFVGQEFRRKGLAHAIETVAMVRRLRPQTQAQLVVLGNADADQFRRYASKLGIAAAVRFVGGTSNPAPYYRAADALLLPTYYDPFANVTVEALACGLPVITTSRNGGSEAIEHGKTGWIVSDPSDVQAMSGFMIEAADPSRLKQMRVDAEKSSMHYSLPERLREAEVVLIEAAD